MARLFRSILALFFLAALIVPAEGASPAKAAQQREFASFIDGFIAGVRRDWNVPGMTFIAVQDGEVLFKKGYGHTSLDGTVEISADDTIFRVGDISQIFTAIAVLQLVEKGRLSLEDDVNTYLRRNTLSPMFGSHITLAHLLTHTAGFDYKYFETQAESAAEERGFANRLVRIMPERSSPPGKVFCYSRMGYALLGSIVERYSRQSFASAAKRHIFTPLNMASSSFSFTDDDVKKMAVGYDKDMNARPYTYHYDMPAMSMNTTAADMGRFMISALSDGQIGRGRVLNAANTSKIFTTQFDAKSPLDGTTFGMMEAHVLGVRTLQKKGDIPGFSSFLMMIPEKKFGIFFSANVTGLDLGNELAAALIDRLFRGDVKTPEMPSKDPIKIPADAAGSYRTNKISRHTAEKVMGLFADQIDITTTDDAIELRRSSSDSKVQIWRPISGDASGKDATFAEIDDFGRPTGRRLFFVRENGEVRSMIIDSVYDTFDKLATDEEIGYQIAAFAVFGVVFAISAAGALISASFNKGKMPWEKGLRASTELWTISTIFCAIQSAFILGLFISWKSIGDQFTTFVPYQVKALFVIPLAGCIVLAWYWVRIVANIFAAEHHWAEKIALAAIAVGETFFVSVLFNWRLLGFMF